MLLLMLALGRTKGRGGSQVAEYRILIFRHFLYCVRKLNFESSLLRYFIALHVQKSLCRANNTERRFTILIYHCPRAGYCQKHRMLLTRYFVI